MQTLISLSEAISSWLYPLFSLQKRKAVGDSGQKSKIFMKGQFSPSRFEADKHLLAHAQECASALFKLKRKYWYKHLFSDIKKVREYFFALWNLTLRRRYNRTTSIPATLWGGCSHKVKIITNKETEDISSKFADVLGLDWRYHLTSKSAS